jgi:serine phosphatase RsbU (regulator of sigma subunit)
MRAHSLEDLVLLGEGEAVQKHFDARNFAVLRPALAVFAALAAVGLLVGIIQEDALRAGISLANLLLALALFTLRDTDTFAKHFRHVLLLYLLLQLLFFILPLRNPVTAVAVAGFLYPLGLLALRLRVSEHLLLLGTCWAVAFALRFRTALATGRPLWDEQLVGASISIGLLLAAATAITRRQRRRFLADWRREASRRREQLRMRQEIETARRIQMAMLPQGIPQADWIDFAAVSLPAAEVGGDYYDFIQLGPGRLALAVGDVAGHGLASGLVLSGVRSGLILLEGELADPVGVLERLDRMVGRTSDRRTFVTLLVALLDLETGTLTVASAGHPPVMLYSSRTRRLEEVAHGAPPLGTRLPARYRSDVRPLAGGDLLVLYTDGLIETVNDAGREYGQARLERAIGRSEGGRTAREIRDAILEDLSSFKGDADQLDDITLVVVRVR